MKRVEVQARTVEEARRAIAQRLAADEGRIQFEVLQEAKPGLFGLGGSKAWVRGTLQEGRGDVAKGFMKDFLHLVGDEAVVVTRQDDDHIVVSASGDFAWFTKRDGEALDALQRIVNVVVQRATERGEVEGEERIVLDMGGFREERRRQLERMAEEVARQVFSEGKPATLEPMPPLERRVVHMALAAFPGIRTRSEGEDPKRRIVVEREEIQEDAD